MTGIEQLLMALHPELKPLPKVEPKQPKFFAHVSKKDLQICAISPSEECAEDLISIPVDSALAVRFMAGTESTSKWCAFEEDDKFILVKANELADRMRRVDLVNIQEVPWNKQGLIDVRLIVNPEKDEVAIHYIDEQLESWKNGIRFYFTKEGDPTFLKKSFFFEINTLLQQMHYDNADRIPNPIRLKVPSVNDLSVFTQKSNIKITIENEASNNRV